MTSLALLCVCVASSFLDPAKAHIPTCIGTDVSPADGDTFECSKQAADEECGRKYYVIQDIAWQCRRLGGDDCESTGLCSCVSAGFCNALSKAELQPRQEVSSKETAPQRCACENPGHSTFSECTQSKICACNGRVRLGYDTRWSEWKDVTGSIKCSNKKFGGDPAPKQAKECVCDSTDDDDDDDDNGDKGQFEYVGQGYCTGSNEIYKSKAWELASRSGGQKSFDTTEYTQWRAAAWKKCLKKDAETEFVSTWTDAGYRCYKGGSCNPNNAGNVRSWSPLAELPAEPKHTFKYRVIRTGFKDDGVPVTPDWPKAMQVDPAETGYPGPKLVGGLCASVDDISGNCKKSRKFSMSCWTKEGYAITHDFESHTNPKNTIWGGRLSFGCNKGPSPFLGPEECGQLCERMEGCKTFAVRVEPKKLPKDVTDLSSAWAFVKGNKDKASAFHKQKCLLFDKEYPAGDASVTQDHRVWCQPDNKKGCLLGYYAI